MKQYNFEILTKEPFLLYEYVRGSHAYGLQKPDGTSDIDLGGVYILPNDTLLGLRHNYVEQVSSKSNDETYYELNRFIELLLKANPNVLEALFIPQHCIRYEHPIITELKKYRDKFITQDCFKPFLGYSYSQIQKARGLNKKFLQENLEKKGVLDFTYAFNKQGSINIVKWLNERGLYQKYCGLVKVKNMKDNYSLFYDFGQHFQDKSITINNLLNGQQLNKEFYSLLTFILETFNLTTDTITDWFNNQHPLGYKGIVSETVESNEVRLSSVEKGSKPIAFISFNLDGYSAYCSDYKSQEEWKKQRNPERYKENCGKMFDRKNIAHAVRLLHMGLEIAKYGQVNIDRTNIDRDFIMNIRLGNTQYEEIISYLESKKDEMEDAMKHSTLPKHVDNEFVNDFIINVRRNL